ncbi:putative pectinesterase/pectinesterase inhibitor 58 [Cocos nucifera]|uniref:Putative pectinesterase/pectinesterase inhibitor 58 n=1 Tax=Cocos nucifera TaxID=13894 RepID=A0A8K0N1V3_COCNU|nr:putative pectinesterase/pectinesterase inhibitor 58 [Cocos nucifera]
MRPGNALLLLAISSALLPLASPRTVPHGGFPPSPTAPRKPPVDPRVIPFCNQTDHPKICIKSARFYSHAYQAINATNMFDITIHALRDRVASIKARAHALSQSQTWNEVVLNGIHDCLGLYADALDDVNEGVQAFVTRDRGTFETRLSAVITMFGTCDDAFMEGVNPLAKQNDRLMNMASNCIAIGQLSFQ